MMSSWVDGMVDRAVGEDSCSSLIFFVVGLQLYRREHGDRLGARRASGRRLLAFHQ